MSAHILKLLAHSVKQLALWQTSAVLPDEVRALPALVLAAAGALVADINARVVADGFPDLRPAHGFAFLRLSHGGATVTELAEHLGVTRQAASQMVDELVGRGYLDRRPHPSDARARLVVLTDRGWACTRSADRAMAAAIEPWIAELGEDRVRALVRDLARVTPPGPIRPTW